MKHDPELRKRLGLIAGVTIVSVAVIIWGYGVLIRGGSAPWAIVYTAGFLALALISGLAGFLLSQRRSGDSR